MAVEEILKKKKNKTKQKAPQSLPRRFTKAFVKGTLPFDMPQRRALQQQSILKRAPTPIRPQAKQIACLLMQDPTGRHFSSASHRIQPI